MQSPPLNLPPAGVLFDAPLGDRPEDLLALTLLYALDAKDEIRAAALSVSKSNLRAAQFCESLARFLQGGTPFLRLPVGLTSDDHARQDSPMFDPVLQARDGEDEPRYPFSIRGLNDTADNVPLLRNALTAYHNGNAIVVCTGRATNLAKLLALPGARGIAAEKARLLVLTSAAASDAEALAAVRKHWPTPIVMAGEALDRELTISHEALASKIAWTKNHPVLAAWQASGGRPASGAALAAVFHAARPKSEDLTLGPADGNIRPLQLTAGSAARLTEALLELLAFQPVPRRRFRPPPAEVKPPEKPKPPSGPA
jgi:hypothetical protein